MYPRFSNLDQEPTIFVFRLRTASFKRFNSIATLIEWSIQDSDPICGSDRRIACMPIAILAVR